MHAEAAGNPGSGQTLFNTASPYCMACHVSPPEGGRLSAANDSSVIANAIANDYGGTYVAGGTTGMGRYSASGAQPLSATQLNNLSAYFGWYVVATTAAKSATVAYNSSANVIDLSSSITVGTPSSISIASGPSHGTINASSVDSSGSSVVTTVTYTPTSGYIGTDTFTYTVTNNAGTSSAATVTVTVSPPPAPVVSSGGAAAGVSGTAYANLYQITASNSPTSYGASNLPPGLGVNSATGVISGTPTTAGTYNATVSATNAGGTGTKAVTFSISLGAPSITSSLSASGSTGNAFSYTITATNSPTSFNATGLPAGLSVNTATGAISGTPSANGTSNVSISATNATGTDTKTLVITVSLSAPSITSTLTASGATGVAFTPYTITATNGPSSFNATGLPAGLSVNTATGVISGTPSASGSFNVSISATNATATDSKTLVITIALSSPSITSANSASGTYAQAFSYLITASNSPTSFNATGLPAGLSVNTTTGLISGTPASGGVSTVTVSATNATATASMALTINIAYVAPTGGPATATTAFNAPVTITLPLAGQYTQVNVTTPPAHGSAPAPAPNANTIIYTPGGGYSGADSFVYTVSGPGGTSPAYTVNITVSTQVPSAAATTMTVPLNTATTLDLAPFIGGSAISGVSVTALPAHGNVAVNGTKVTFTPANNYFGADAFSYVAYGNAGTSAAAVVTVNVTGRPDPMRDPTVTALLSAQVETARRFSRAQISNFQSHLESLHRRPAGNATDLAQETEAPASASTTGTIGTAGKGSYLQNPRGARPMASSFAGGAYQPAASLTANAVGGLKQPAPATQAEAIATVANALAASSHGAADAGMMGKALAMAANAAQGASLNLAAVGNAMAPAPASDSGIDIWVGGNIRFGSRNPDNSDGWRFTSDGVSMGADQRITDKLVVGAGIGYGRDTTDIGTDGSNSRGNSTTVAAYASYQPTANTYLDGVLGYGQLDYRSDRFVAPMNAFARSQRSGDFLFGSLTAGYEFGVTGLRVSPYGRLDVAQHRLKAVTENGAGLYALTYDSQTIPSLQLSAGLRAESKHETGFGWVLPRMRVEFQHEFKGEQQASVAYADQVGGPRYTLPASASNTNSLVLGVGSDFILGRGLTISLDYQMQRSSNQENVQAVFFKLIKDLDGKSPSLLSSSAFSAGALGLKVDAGVTFDDNVTRASNDANKFADQTYGVNIAKSMLFELGGHTRAFVNGFVGAQRFKTYTGLNNFSAGMDAELQYRASGDFDSPIWGLFGNLVGSSFESDKRDGYRYSLGLNLRQTLTDRLSLFGAVARNQRFGRSAVFDGRDYSARINLDYAAARAGTLYVTGEYRYGDIVSTGTHTLANINIAKVFTPDDVFVRNGLYAYRFEGSTVIATLGYNHALGPKDSLDFSWRRVLSMPSDSTGIPGVGRPRYVVNQFSFMYLTSF